MVDLTGRVAIVTGAGSGIGRGIAEVFALEVGATVVLAERDAESGEAAASAIVGAGGKYDSRILAERDAESGEAAASAIVGAGGKAIHVTCDVSDELQVAQMISVAVQQFGRVDILVNNAGINFVKPFEQLTSADWDRVLNVDLRGAFLCTRGCIERFIEQGMGAVVNIASVHTMAAVPGAAAYDAAKWGIVGMTKSLACEYASRNIRFNCISPGLIDTQIWTDLLAAAEDVDACRAHWWANIPAARAGTPQEIGRIAAFLASEEASYVTGANLCADGGMTSQLISKETYRSNPIE